MSTNPTTIEAPAGTPFLETTREFDATPAQLFRVQTDPELVVQWLGPRDLEMTIEQYDVRPGGSYRYLHRRGDEEYAFRGVFHTVEPETLVIQTFEWEGAPGEVCLERATYEKTDTGVRLHTQSIFPSIASRDAAVESGMVHGINESMDRLAELIARGEGK